MTSWSDSRLNRILQNLKDFSAIGIDIELTDDGVNHVQEIVTCVFSYIGEPSCTAVCSNG
jgi:secreted Zn-dependent insulinase-like peptidase